MTDLDLLVDFHLGGVRQGPGADDLTVRAIDLSGLAPSPDLKIADMGCGTGASTLVLAKTLGAQVTAVDLFPGFLQALEKAARVAGVSDRVETVQTSMDDVPFPDGSFDAIWSEGAIYSIGFATGVRAWRKFLKPNGILAVSELTWLTADRPQALTDHWTQEYPEVDTASGKLGVLEAAGYSPIGYFPLPERCWIDMYYRPMEDRFASFLNKHGQSDAARALVEAERAEIALYKRYRAYVSYGYYVARRTP